MESARTIEFDITGVDIVFDGDICLVCEINSAPGFEGFELTTRINVPKEIYR